MVDIKRRWLGNASANIAGGVFTTLFNLILPAILVRHLNATDFALWNLILQVVVYLQIFSAGLQSAVGRFVAIGNERKDLVDQINTIGAAIRVALVCVSLALIAVVLLSWLYPLLFSGVPPGKINDFRLCVLLVGFSSALQLSVLVPAGICMGRHRNIIFVSSQIVVRLLTLAGLALMSLNDASLVEYSLSLAILGGMLIPLSYWMISISYPDLMVFTQTTKERFKEISSFCASLSIWSISMLMVNGLSIAMTGYFDFKHVSAYAMAVALINIMLGLLNAAMSPMTANFAALRAGNASSENISNLLNKVTRILILVIFVGVFCAIFLGELFLRFWVGNDYAEQIYPILIVISFSAAFRNFCLPYSLVILALGKPKQATAGVLLEGGLSITSCAILGALYGATGIAFGAVLASFAGVFYNTHYLFQKIDCIGGVKKYINREVYPWFFVLFFFFLIFCLFRLR